MAIDSVFFLSRNKKYNYKTHDEGADISIKNCVATMRKSGEDGVTRQIAYHAHSVYEMHYILEGECEFETDNGTKYTLLQNQFIIIPHQKRHRVLNESEIFSKIITDFDIRLTPEKENDFYRVFEEKMLNVEVYTATDELLWLVTSLLKNIREKRHEYRSIISSYLYAYLIESARIAVGTTQIRRKNDFDDPRVSEAVSFIKENITKCITTKEVSSKCFISTKQLVRIFQKELGTTPSEYIRRCKIDYARRLLLETDIQVGEIAEQLGFTEVTAFINFFRRYEDITPAKFRKRSR